MTDLRKVIRNGALALCAASTLMSAHAGVNVNVNIGTPGYYGPVTIGPGIVPQIWNANPIIAIGAALAGVAPLYLHVPEVQRLNWHQYCGWYNACRRPVYFVKETWYRQHYPHHPRPGYAPPPPPPRPGFAPPPPPPPRPMHPGGHPPKFKPAPPPHRPGPGAHHPGPKPHKGPPGGPHRGGPHR